MLLIKVGHQQFHVARIAEILVLFDGSDFGQDLGIHLFRKDFGGVFPIFGGTGHHVGNDESFEVLLVFEGVFHGQNATP